MSGRDGWVYRSGTRYHWPSDEDGALAACGRFVLDVDHSGQAFQLVPDFQRCQRRACQRRFDGPAAAAEGAPQ
jgi:hypothetical protein